MENAIASLRPMRLGEILDQAIRLYRRNFVKFIGIVAIIIVPFELITHTLSYFFSRIMASALGNTDFVFSSSYWLTIFGFVALLIVQFILVYGMAAAAMARAVTDHMTGQTFGILEAYRHISSSWGTILAALIMMIFLVLGLMLATVIPCIGWLVGPGLLTFLSFAVNPLLAPTLVIEGRGAGASIRRAWDLARRRFWWLMGFMFILYLFSQLIVTGPALLTSSILAVVFGSQYSVQNPLLSTLITGLITTLTTLLYVPLQLCAFTLVYYDLRVRTEGFDLAVGSMQTLEKPLDTEAIRSIPTPPAPARPVEWSDVGNFVLLTILFVAIYFLFVGVLIGFFMAIAAAAGGF